MSDCPGKGKCHGCVKWCDECGDVDLVCDAASCNAHRCHECSTVLSRAEHEFWSWDWARWCFACTVSLNMQAAIRRDQDEVAAGAKTEREIEQWLEQEGYHS